MNIVAQELTIVEYTQRLSAQDLERYLADPHQWAADVRAQLQPNGPAAPAASAAPNGHDRRAHARPGRRAGGGPKPQTRKLPNQCPHCDETFGRAGNLARHIARVHPAVSPTSS